MKKIDFAQIDSMTLEIGCNHGIAEGIEICGIPLRLYDKIKDLKIADGLVVPEKFRRHFSVICNNIDHGDNTMSLQLRIKFLSCSIICLDLKQSIFNFVFFDKAVKIKFVCGRNQDFRFKESMLAIDLGNTRTCAVVCPDITQQKMEKLILRPHFNPDSVLKTPGVWNSVCILGKTEAFKDVSTSFIRVGEEYDEYYRSGTEHQANMLRSLSTPKRYFWDDELDRDWSIAQPGSKQGLNLKQQKDVELAHVIAENSFNGKYPRAMMLEGIIYELLEQTDRMLNKHENFGNDKDDLPVRNWHNDSYYLLKHLVVTFPAAWSRAEVMEYRNVIQRCVDYFVSQRCGAEPIELHMECNEATAVLINYIYSEASRFGSGKRWLNLMGKKDHHGNRTLRVGVIDIGGGTSDLAIAQVSWDTIAHATKITTLYTYGTNEAGDTMIARIIKEFIFDKVFEKMIRDTAVGKKREDIKTFVVQKVLPNQKALSRSFWFPLAVKYLEENVKCESITIYDSSDKKNQFNIGFETLKRKIIDMLDKDDDPEIKKLAVYLQSSDSDDKKNKVEIKFSKDDYVKYVSLLQENFEYSPMTFGAAISAYDCNMVVWSGKTSENPEIRELFEKQIPVPPSSFVSMNDYTIKADEFPLTGLDGKLTDSKYATAIGAAIYSLLQIGKDIHFPLTVNNTGDANLSYWGTIDRIGNFTSYLEPNTNGEALTYNGGRLLIYRKNSDSPLTSAMPAYEFRSKPSKNIKIEGDIRFVLRQGEGVLDFELRAGNFYLENGTVMDVNTPDAKDYFELRIRMVSEEEIWLDTGKIF